MTDSSSRGPEAVTPPPDWEVLARYVTGEASPEEMKRTARHLAMNPQDAELLVRLQETWEHVAAVPPVVPDLDVEAALRKTRERLAAPVVVPLSSRRPLWRSIPLQVAAAAALAVIGGVVWRNTRPEDVSIARTMVAPVGGPDSVALADGSLAVLAPGSSLTIPAGYPAESRTLVLEGQGWFRVSHDGAHPFVVRAGEAEIQDVGTEFSIQTGAATRVSVHDGVVLVRVHGRQADDVRLERGDAATVASDRSVAVQRQSVGDGEASWVSGTVRLRDVTLEALGNTLKAWYGITLDFADPSLQGEMVSVDLNAGRVRDVLQEVSLVHGLEVVWDGDKAVLSRSKQVR